jgi:iron complex transport system ATP-binding protein
MLSAKRLSYRIGSHFLLRGFHQSFEPGRIYGILGPNGSGKSTLLKLLSGIWTPSDGSVEWNGQDLGRLSRKDCSKIISLVPQNPLPLFPYTTQEMVAMGRYPFGSDCPQTVLDALEQVDALDLIDRPITEISGGERQKIYIARSIASGAPILLLDEPTASLDIHHQLLIWEILKACAARGKVVLVALHQLEFARRFCNHVSILFKGNLITHGSYETVMTPDLLTKVFQVRENKEQVLPEFVI